MIQKAGPSAFRQFDGVDHRLLLAESRRSTISRTLVDRIAEGRLAEGVRNAAVTRALGSRAGRCSLRLVEEPASGTNSAQTENEKGPALLQALN